MSGRFDHRLWIARVVATAVTLAGCSSGKRVDAETESRSSNAAQCQSGQWTPPAPLFGAATTPTRVARSPSIVDDETNLYVVGNDVPFLDQEVRIGETLTAWRRGYGSIGAPAKDLVFVSPRASLDATGRLHVLWAEPAEHGETIPPYQWILLETSSLWTAVYEPQHGWSAPSRIHSGSIDWNWGVTTGAISRDAGGSSVIAVPNGDGALVLALQSGRWAATALPLSTKPSYLSALSLANRRLLAVVAADTTQRHDRNSVFLYVQDDGGPWRFLRQVQRSGSQPAMEVRLIRGPGGRVHLVWRQMIRQDHFVIRHVYSDDGGASFSEPGDLLPGGIIQSLVAATDICGELYVAYEDWSEGMNAVRIGSATWNGRWSEQQRLHASYAAGDLELVKRTDGSLMLVFLGTAEKGNDRRNWQTMFSELR